MKTLVAYFSASGTTEGVAKKVAEAAGAWNTVKSR